MDILMQMLLSDREPSITASRAALARGCRCSAVELDHALEELSQTKTAHVTIRDGFVTVVSRRLLREQRQRQLAAARQVRSRQRKQERSGHAPRDDPSQRSSSASASASSDADALPLSASKNSNLARPDARRAASPSGGPAAAAARRAASEVFKNLSEPDVRQPRLLWAWFQRAAAAGVFFPQDALAVFTAAEQAAAQSPTPVGLFVRICRGARGEGPQWRSDHPSERERWAKIGCAIEDQARRKLRAVEAAARQAETDARESSEAIPRPALRPAAEPFFDEAAARRELQRQAAELQAAEQRAADPFHRSE